MKICAWHECRRPFEPEDPRQTYCSPACQKARGAWKARRGAPLVDMLLAGDGRGLIAAKRRLEEEIKDAASDAD